MNILMPVDGSPCSERAIDYLIRHTAWFREAPHVHVLHVHPPIPMGRVQAHVDRNKLEDYYREESEARLQEARRRFDTAGLGYTVHIHVGQPAEVISKLAKELGCELIVMGSHGHGMVASLVTGSIAAKVLELSSCPVLLVK